MFKVDNNQLIPIFYEPVYSSEMLAGEWSKDGTRSHDFSETESFVSLLSQKTQGYFNLRVSTNVDTLGTVFHWNAIQKRYNQQELNRQRSN